ncbi:MAG: hypothetical protein EOO51_01245 [Flavobacterium sp.]|nr:MAG: hypothetical protein EOO51_01245 [Flavobacterium sp.]
MQNNLPFRPHDNNITTQMKYDLEARHWNQAFEYERIRNQSFNVGRESGIVLAIVTIVISLATILVVAMGWVLKRIFK